jgi:hypothetical protein
MWRDQTFRTSEMPISTSCGRIEVQDITVLNGMCPFPADINTYAVLFEQVDSACPWCTTQMALWCKDTSFTEDGYRGWHQKPHRLVQAITAAMHAAPATP